MRKVLLTVLTVLLACSLLSASAEQPDAARAWFDDQAAQLIPYGVEAERKEATFLLKLPDGAQAQSLCLTVEGDIRFGRYAQVTRATLIDPDTGRELGLDAVFADLDALQEYLDAYVEGNVLDALNTYLDAGDLLPIPLDCVSFDEYGVTFHYPSERFMFFSGHAGAVQLMWDEVKDHLMAEPVIPPGGGFGLFSVLNGDVCGLRLGEDANTVLARYGQVTEPDVLGDGLLYEFESPLLRGALAVVEDGAVRAVRVTRPLVVSSLWADISQGEAGEVRTLTAEDAAMLRALPGTAAGYADLSLLAGGAPCSLSGLTAYFNADGALYMIEFRL